MKKKIIISLAAVLVIGAVFLWQSKGGVPGIHRKTEFLMDTYVTIQALGKKNDVLKAIDDAFAEMERVEKKFTLFDPGNPVYGFNGNSDEITDPEIIYLAEEALKISRKSGGNFDITVKPLIQLWGFYNGRGSLPAENKIKQVLKQVDYRLLEIRDGVLTKKNKKVEIDFGSIAKGYALSRAAASLKKSGISSALIDAGGDIYALGSLDGKPWKIGIRNPRGEGIAGVVRVSSRAVVTSGDYERGFTQDGRRYHHILDPATGYPADGPASVTVIAGRADIADGWATALFAAGTKSALKMFRENPEIEGVIVGDEGEIYYSSGAEEMLTIEEK